MDDEKLVKLIVKEMMEQKKQDTGILDPRFLASNSALNGLLASKENNGAVAYQTLVDLSIEIGDLLIKGLENA